MLLSNPPALRLQIKPVPGTDGALSRLSITYILDPPTYSAHHLAPPFLFLYQTFRDNIPAHQYAPGDIQASDAAGPLPRVFTPRSDEDNLQEWRLVEGRQVKGTVILRMNVWPRKVDVSTPLGARIDLRKDQGGLQGAGSWFLPYRFGILPATYVTRCINRKLSAYGTSPTINMSLRNAERNFFSSWYAGNIPY